MQKLALPEHFRRQLVTRLEQVQVNELQLWELPLEIAAWYSAGWAEGMMHAKQQAREYEHKLDLAYIAMMHPKERAALIQRRMQEHFEREAAAFFTSADVENFNDCSRETAA